MSSSVPEKVWVVVRVRKGCTSPEDASVHTGFTDPAPAFLLRDLLNKKSADSRFEFRVLEMPRFGVVRSPRAAAS